MLHDLAKVDVHRRLFIATRAIRRRQELFERTTMLLTGGHTSTSSTFPQALDTVTGVNLRTSRDQITAISTASVAVNPLSIT
jgi:hypothetical protein